MKTKSISKATTFTYTALVASILFLISCGGCGSGKEIKSGNDNTIVTLNSISDIENVDTIKYYYQDVEDLKHLKLEREYKAEILTISKEKFDVKNEKWIWEHSYYLFNEKGNYINKFDQELITSNDLFLKLNKKYPQPLNGYSNQHLKEISTELQKANFGISPKIIAEATFLEINPIFFYVPCKPYSLNRFTNLLIGERSLYLRKHWEAAGYSVFKEYLFYDYTGNLVSTYNHEQLGDEIMIFENGKYSIGKVVKKQEEEFNCDKFRLFDFQKNTQFDLNPYLFNPQIFLKSRIGEHQLCNPFFISTNGDFVQIVYNDEHEQQYYLSIILQIDQRKAYFKTYLFKKEDIINDQWHFFTALNGEIEELSEFEAIPF
jgi:hypothetical protein